MTLKERIVLKAFGASAMESVFADSLLSAYADGLPRTDLPVATGELGFTAARIDKLLVENNFLQPFGNGFVITSLGKMHLDKGGYIGQYISHKASRLSFILSFIATALSIVAICLSL